MTTTTAQAPHHPNFLGAQTDGDGNVTYKFAPFTGGEDMPDYDWTVARQLDEASQAAYRDEFDAARRQWRVARFRAEFAADVARASAEAGWEKYQQASQAMDKTFTRLMNADDRRWPALIAALLDAQDAAEKAAESWDSTCGRLARRYHQLRFDAREDAPGWDEVRKTMPVDWSVGYYPHYREHAGIGAPTSYSVEYLETTYHHGSPLAHGVRDAIRSQKRRIREVRALMAGLDTGSR